LNFDIIKFEGPISAYDWV